MATRRKRTEGGDSVERLSREETRDFLRAWFRGTVNRAGWYKRLVSLLKARFAIDPATLPLDLEGIGRMVGLSRERLATADYPELETEAVAWAAARCIEAKLKAGGVSSGDSDSGPAAGERRKRRRYKTDNDPETDARLVRDWKAAKGQGVRTVAEFCESRGIDEGDFRAAQERHRHR